MRKFKHFFLPGKWEIVLTRRDPLHVGISLGASSDVVLVPPFGVYWADPFIVAADDRTVVFFEEFVFKTARGRICAVEVYSDGTKSPPRAVIEEPFHLSFPNVFQYHGRYYLVPESSDANCIRLYEATCFPYEWIYCGNLIEEIDAVDTIFIEKSGKWFLLTSEPGGGGADDRGTLSIYIADSPVALGGWIPHPANPVVNNCEHGRNGGAVLYYGGKLMRPAQNSSRDYGESLTLMNIEEINSASYKETPSLTLSPPGLWITNVHTINEASGLWCYDQMRISAISVLSMTWCRLLIRIIRSRTIRRGST